MTSVDAVRIDEQHSPVASAIVFKTKAALIRHPISDKEVVVARKYNPDKDKWITIAKGEAGVDDASVIQRALDSLTAGRTWKEKVVLKGDFVLSTAIKIPSYTVLHIDGRVRLADGVNKHVIQNQNWSSGNEHIDIIGGIIDGNKENQPEFLGRGIHLQNVTYFRILNVFVTRCRVHGISIRSCKKGIIGYCIAAGNGADGITVHGSDASNPSTEVNVIGNICTTNDDTGIVVKYSSKIRVIGNFISGSGYNGISIYSSSKNIIANNHSINNSRLHDNYDGIRIHDDGETGSFKNIIVGNICFDEQSPKRQAYGIRSTGIGG